MDVQFKSGQGCFICQTLGHSHVIIDCGACNIDIHGQAILGQGLQYGDLLLQEPVHTHIGQANGIEHAGVGFYQPGNGIALARFEADTLGDKAP